MANVLTLEDAEERAAIREFCAGMTRDQAETLTARDYGYRYWDELKKDLYAA